MTITNHSGNLGLPTGPSPSASFSLPTRAHCDDESAMVTDVEQCPAGLHLPPAVQAHFPSRTPAVSFTKAITNVNAVCDGEFGLTNI